MLMELLYSTNYSGQTDGGGIAPVFLARHLLNRYSFDKAQVA